MQSTTSNHDSNVDGSDNKTNTNKISSLLSILLANTTNNYNNTITAENLSIIHPVLIDLIEITGGEENLPQHDNSRTQVGEVGVHQYLGSMLQSILSHVGTATNDEGGDLLQHLDVILLIIKLIRNLARDRTLHEILVTTTCPVILEIMKRYRTKRFIEIESLRALLNLSISNQMILCEMGTHIAVCDTAILANERQANESVTISKLSCEVISRLALDVQARHTYLKESATKLLMDVLFTHANLAAVVDCSLQMLCVLVGDLQSAEYVGNSGNFPGETLQTITRSARAHLLNVSICEWFCRCVCALSRCPENREKLLVFGLLAFVADAMRTHAPHHIGVAAFGCAAFRAASHQHHSNKISLVKSLGATELILMAMRSHMTSEIVSFYGCSAIWALANELDNKVVMMKANADIVVINTMRTNPDSIHVNTQACAALWSLANYNRGKGQLIRNGAPQAIIRALRKFMQQRSDIALNGTAALWSMSFLIPVEVRNSLLELGCSKIVIDVMKLYVRDVDICSKCLGTLSCLTDEGVNKSDVEVLLSVDYDLLKILMQCYREHVENIPFIEQLCEVWANIGTVMFQQQQQQRSSSSSFSFSSASKKSVGDNKLSQPISEEWQEIRNVANILKGKYSSSNNNNSTVASLSGLASYSDNHSPDAVGVVTSTITNTTTTTSGEPSSEQQQQQQQQSHDGLNKTLEKLLASLPTSTVMLI
jgi:hypothetical protein